MFVPKFVYEKAPFYWIILGVLVLFLPIGSLATALLVEASHAAHGLGLPVGLIGTAGVLALVGLSALRAAVRLGQSSSERPCERDAGGVTWATSTHLPVVVPGLDASRACRQRWRLPWHLRRLAEASAGV